jgi:menaquinone-9 beta-reductase
MPAFDAFDTDVFVIGGGPAGLSAAIAARLRGLRVIVAEAAESVVDKCCGEGLMPDGVAALRQLGVAIPADSARFHGIAFYNARPGERPAQGQFTSGSGFGVRRTLLHRQLINRAIEVGVDCRFHTRVSGIGLNCVLLDHQRVRTHWIIGADGFRSRVRLWANLNRIVSKSDVRYGFRKHFQMDRVPNNVEIHWADDFQVVLTPINSREANVTVTSGNSKCRLDHALTQLPELRCRLGASTTAERGGTTASFALPSVYRGNIALVGDASGAVDSIAGEGLCLAFRQALHLATAIANNDLAAYAMAHRSISWPPRLMARLLLWLGGHRASRQLALRMLANFPGAFRALLSAHAGEAAPCVVISGNGIL